MLYDLSYDVCVLEVALLLWSLESGVSQRKARRGRDVFLILDPTKESDQ